MRQLPKKMIDAAMAMGMAMTIGLMACERGANQGGAGDTSGTTTAPSDTREVGETSGSGSETDLSGSETADTSGGAKDLSEGTTGSEAELSGSGTTDMGSSDSGAGTGRSEDE
jgi:hypothetical protein